MSTYKNTIAAMRLNDDGTVHIDDEGKVEVLRDVLEARFFELIGPLRLDNDTEILQDLDERHSHVLVEHDPGGGYWVTIHGTTREALQYVEQNESTSYIPRFVLDLLTGQRYPVETRYLIRYDQGDVVDLTNE